MVTGRIDWKFSQDTDRTVQEEKVLYFATNTRMVIGDVSALLKDQHAPFEDGNFCEHCPTGLLEARWNQSGAFTLIVHEPKASR